MPTSIRFNGKKFSPLYSVWTGMRKRCLSTTSKDYPRYGGRGICICREWDSFENFHKWATSNGYRDGLEIDRADNDRGYSPENCRFVTRLKNIRNSSKCRLSENDVEEIKRLYFCDRLTQSKIASMFKVVQPHVSQIVNGVSWKSEEVE